MIRLRQLLRWLDISEADMEKGHLRCDANVSVRIKGSDVLNAKTEIKNVNSIESLRAAIEMEFKRQVREIEAGNRIEAWTLDWDEDTQTLQQDALQGNRGGLPLFPGTRPAPGAPR